MADPKSFSPAHSVAAAPLGAMTWSWNVASGEVTWSAGIEQALFGLPEGSFAGTFEAYLELVHPDDRAYFAAVIERTVAGEDEYVMAHRVVWPDGSTHWVDGRGRLSRDAEGRPLVLDGVAWSKTARNVAQASVALLEQERKVVQQQLLLSDRLASLGRLAAGVAHEINNPLGYLVLGLESIEKAARTESPTAEVLARISAAAAEARDGAGRVRGVVQALSALSRDDEGAVGQVDLHRVLDGAVRLTENNVRHRGRIIKDYRAVSTVRGNDLRLGQVFVNLLVNACDALRDDRADVNEIRVRTFDAGNRVVIEVHDNGVGIAPEIRDRIFDPFCTTKAVGMGTGLGLSISQGIVASFGGEIGFESSAATGTTFRVSLAIDGAPPAETNAATPRAAGVKRCRLLIVDDEERLARSLAALLSSHHVTTATTVTDALSLVDQESFDCILCDLMMPTLSGMDLHAELERRGHGLERRMIFMTGGAFTPRAREFVARVSSEVLEKPFGTSLVERAIAGLLAREVEPATPTPPDLRAQSPQWERTQ